MLLPVYPTAQVILEREMLSKKQKLTSAGKQTDCFVNSRLSEAFPSFYYILYMIGCTGKLRKKTNCGNFSSAEKNKGNRRMKKIELKRLLSAVLSVAMLISMLPTVVSADEATSRVIYGSYEDGVWVQDPDGTGTVTTEEGFVLTKVAVPDEDDPNKYTITLGVQTSTTTTTVNPTSAATVLVIDVSGSMKYCAECGGNGRHDRKCDYSGVVYSDQSRMAAAKNAALGFIESYAGETAGVGRYLAIVKFSDYASTVLEWVDVSGGEGEDGYDNAVTEINNLNATGGTNLDDGLEEANGLMGKNAVSMVPAANRNVIALTDGIPTYYNTEYGRGGNGRTGSEQINNATAETAGELRENAYVYTVCFGVANDVCYSGGPTVGAFLENSIATPRSTDEEGSPIVYAYNADNSSELNAAFEAITSSITEGISGEGFKVTDPMSPDVDLDQGSVNADVIISSNGTDTIEWSLSNPEVTTEGDTTYYTYTMSYEIEVDSTVEGFEEGKHYPANGETYLEVPSADSEESSKYYFPVPAVTGVAPRFTVIYDCGAHGELKGQNSDGQVVHEDIIMHAATPEAPEVIPAEKYYFTGWTPAVAETVTEDVTYVAQYGSQFEIKIRANSAEELYNGEEHTASGYTVDGMPEGFVLDGVTAEVSGVDAGTYTNEVNCDKLVITRDGEDVTHMFYISTADGTLTIRKRSVTLTSATDSKEYDGTPLTNDTVTVGGDGFAVGEGAEYDVTGSQLTVGTSSNSFTYTLNDNTNAANYKIDTEIGQLTVTNRDAKYEITVVANSNEVKYDGAEHSVSGFETLTFTVEGQTYTVEELSAEAAGTDAGTYTANVTGTAVVKDVYGNDVTSEFAVTTQAGQLVITKREVILTSASAEKEYDGEPLTNDKVTVSGDGFVNGEGASYNVTGSRTLVGTSDNSFTYTLNEGTLAENYNITSELGQLTVTSREAKYQITVQANSGEYTYDGTEKTVEGFKTLTFEVDGNTYTVEGLTASASRTDAGSSTVVVSGTTKVLDENNNDVTSEFAVSFNNGTLTISKREVILTSASASKQYDGTPLTNDTVTVSGDGFAEGEGAEYNVTGTQTLVGSSKNAFTYTLNEGTKAENYEITKEEGTLEVLNREKAFEITVEANSGEFKYDGTEKTVSGFKTLDFEIKGVKFTVEGIRASVTETNAGTYTNMVEGTPAVKDADGNDVTSQFIVKTVDGTLKISKRSVTLTSATDSKQYDGTLLTNDTVTVTGDGFADGEGAEYDVTGSQRVVGSSANTFTYELNDGTEADNYIITTVYGQLTVTNREAKFEIAVAANSDEVMYDGTEKTAEGLVEDTFIFNGETFVVSNLTAKQTSVDAGTYAVNVEGTAVVTDAYGNDVTDQFTVEVHAGQLVITKRPVTLTSATDEKEYDGTALTNDEVTVGGEGFAEGEGASYDVTGSQTLVGSSENHFTYTLDENTKADNYTITTNNGLLTVVTRNAKYQVEVEANSDEFLYDGEEKIVTGFITLEVEAENGLIYTVEGLTAEGEGTDAGEYPVNITGTPVVRDADGNDVTSEFAVTVISGKLVINKRTVVLTSASASKQYDGTPLTNDTVTVSGDGFAEGESVDCVVTGTQTLVGSSPNYFTYTLGADTKAENYDITKAEGTLTVSHRDAKFEITVEANSGEFKYDGEEKFVEGFKTLEFTVNGLKYTVEGLTAEAAETDAGEYPVAVTGTAVVLDADGNDVTSEFAVTVLDGILAIEKRLVILTSGSAFKYSNGTPLTNDEITVTGDGWADNEGADYDVTGSRLYSGISRNTFTYELWENTKASNYEIVVNFGTLEVKEPIVIPMPPMEGDAFLLKVDSADEKTVLADAQFALYKTNVVTNEYDDEFIGVYTTDEHGIIHVSGLRPGKYYWVETRAPEGYMLDDEEHHFAVYIGEFASVTVGNVKTAIPDVFTLDHYAYIIGYPDGGVHPEATITRAEVATIFFRLLSDEVRADFMTDENDFTDVKPGDWFNRAVSTMAAMGVVKGYPDGSFNPNGKITRAEFAAIAARFDENGDTTPADFSDIADHWGMEEISIAANNGWVLGYTDNTFQPDKLITRAEAMTLVNRVLQRIVKDVDDLHEDMVIWYDNMDTSKWYYLAVQEATNSHYYIRMQNGFERWLDIRSVRDWAELEN